MKIIYLYDSITVYGGIERIFVMKMNYLAEKLHNEVYLVTSSQGLHPIVFPLSTKVHHIDLDIRFHVQYQYPLLQRIRLKLQLKRLYQKRLQKLVDNVHPDIIIGTTTWNSDTVCRLKCKGKKIIESHSVKAYTTIKDCFSEGFLKDLFNKITTWKRFRYTEMHCDAIVALTRNDAASWKKAANTFVIPNMIENMPEENSICESHRVIAAGRMTYSKRFDRLIDAWTIIHKKHPDWKLDIYGEGYLKNKVQEQIKAEHLEESVTIHPFTSDILQKYADSSIFAMTSIYEGFGMVLIEAMSCGIPCVAFDCPHGPAEIIRHKEDGLLVKDNQIEEFAASINYLIENAETRKAYGKKARENARRFLPEEIMPQWDVLFKQL